jgi:hypothetical protein
MIMTTFANLRVPDDDTLVRAATEALTRPDSYFTSDDNLFWTHGITLGTHRDDDTMGVSNYACVTRDMTEVFPADVYEQHFSHWAVGYGQSLVVRVLRDADDDIEPGNITAAFAAITSIATWLRDDYPLYDESDYSEREYAESQETFDASWGDLTRCWDEDADGPEPSDAEQRACWELGLYEETGWWDHDAFKATIADMRREAAEAAAGELAAQVAAMENDGAGLYAPGTE